MLHHRPGHDLQEAHEPDQGGEQQILPRRT